MHTTRGSALLAVVLIGAACQDITDPGRTAPVVGAAIASSSVTSLVGSIYVADFVATAATGVGMNDAGDVIGSSYPDPGCGPFCLPPLETVVWRGGNRIVLPVMAYPWPGIFPQVINNQGWIAGIFGSPYVSTRAVVWRPSGNTYTVTDLGLLPTMKYTQVGGMDDLGRIVGWTNDAPVFPTIAAPYRWKAVGGMVNLAALGYPNDVPIAVSHNGRVATYTFYYQLGNPASAVAMPAPPRGFLLGGDGTVINDAGDQGRGLVTTSGQSLVYLFRFNAAAGTYQMISSIPTGHLSSGGLGSINSALDITATAGGIGLVAAGPTGLAQPLQGLLSPAYGGAAVTMGGAMNASGAILTRIIIGRSQRLMRMVPAAPCAGNCAKVSNLQMVATFIQDPAHPGSCIQGGKARNDFGVRVTVTNEFGTLLPGAMVSGRFLDDYWMNRPVSGSTNAQGWVQFQSSGVCGVGAIAFLVDNVVAGNRTFDRTTGIVTTSKIPQ